MQGLNDIIERAFKLARSGTCRHPTDVRLRLRTEGYSHVDLFISGESLEADLNRLCHTASDRRAEQTRAEQTRAEQTRAEEARVEEAKAERPIAH